MVFRFCPVQCKDRDIRIETLSDFTLRPRRRQLCRIVRFTTLNEYSRPSVFTGIGFRTPCRYQNPQMENPLCKMVQYLHIAQAHPPIYYKISLDCPQYQIQCNCYVNGCYAVLFRAKKKSVHVHYGCNHGRPKYIVPVSNIYNFFLFFNTCRLPTHQCSAQRVANSSFAFRDFLEFLFIF